MTSLYPDTVVLGNASTAALRSFVERIERLDEEKAALAGDIRDIFAQAKSEGFDVKVMRQVLRVRKKDKSEREEEMSVFDTYMLALGMI
jgi:uncharacterized protein (UPF0335 family)